MLSQLRVEQSRIPKGAVGFPLLQVPKQDQTNLVTDDEGTAGIVQG